MDHVVRVLDRRRTTGTHLQATLSRGYSVRVSCNVITIIHAGDHRKTARIGPVSALYTPEKSTRVLYENHLSCLVDALAAGKAPTVMVVVDGGLSGRLHTLLDAEEGLLMLVGKGLVAAGFRGKINVSAVQIGERETLQDLLEERLDGRGAKLWYNRDPIIHNDGDTGRVRMEGCHALPFAAASMENILHLLRSGASSCHSHIFSLALHSEGVEGEDFLRTFFFVSMVPEEGTRGFRKSRPALNRIFAIDPETPRTLFEATRVTYFLRPALLRQIPAAWISCFCTETPDVYGFRETVDDAFLVAETARRICASRSNVESGTAHSEDEWIFGQCATTRKKVSLRASSAPNSASSVSSPSSSAPPSLSSSSDFARYQSSVRQPRRVFPRAVQIKARNVQLHCFAEDSTKNLTERGARIAASPRGHVRGRSPRAVADARGSQTNDRCVTTTGKAEKVETRRDEKEVREEYALYKGTMEGALTRLRRELELALKEKAALEAHVRRETLRVERTTKKAYASTTEINRLTKYCEQLNKENAMLKGSLRKARPRGEGDASVAAHASTTPRERQPLSSGNVDSLFVESSGLDNSVGRRGEQKGVQTIDFFSERCRDCHRIVAPLQTHATGVQTFLNEVTPMPSSSAVAHTKAQQELRRMSEALQAAQQREAEARRRLSDVEVYHVEMEEREAELRVTILRLEQALRNGPPRPRVASISTGVNVNDTALREEAVALSSDRVAASAAAVESPPSRWVKKDKSWRLCRSYIETPLLPPNQFSSETFGGSFGEPRSNISTPSRRSDLVYSGTSTYGAYSTPSFEEWLTEEGAFRISSSRPT